jgi:serine/threonine-protein kinase
MAATRALLGPSGAEQDRMVGYVLGARYRVLSRLGEGGMGTVYLCEHAVLGRRYAVKVLRPELAQDAELVARFRNEAVAASRIGGENVVDVLDFGTAEDGASYYVMEALEGRSLAAVIGEDGPLAVPRALALLEQLCRALGAAHARGVVHRDVKPDNVFVVPGADGAERAKVIDFGISKVTREEPSAQRLTRAGAIIGTPEYMAPEQAAGEPVDHRADVYALGVLAYEMLTGTLPIVANTPVATLVAHQTRTPEAPSARRPGIPRDVDALVLATLAKRPEDRPASMEAVAAAIAAIRRGAAPALPPPTRSPLARGAAAAGEGSPGPRPRRIVRAGLVLAVAALLAAAVAGGARLARRSQEAAPGAEPGAAAPPHAAGAAAPPSASARAPDAAGPARPPPPRAPARPARRPGAGVPAADRDLQDPYAGGGLKPDPFE